jgi:transposase
MRRYALRDDQWDRIKDILPGREGHVGVSAKDNRLFVEAVFYRYRAGIPWRDLPERFGDPIKIHTRFSEKGSSFRPRVIERFNASSTRKCTKRATSWRTSIASSSNTARDPLRQDRHKLPRWHSFGRRRHLA